MKNLIVYYSRTGTTKIIAEVIRNALNGDLDEIQDTKGRSGIIGWLKAGNDARSKSLIKIQSVDLDPLDYEIVVVGSPTWNGTMSTPIRTYILENKERLRKVALFSTGDSEEPKAVEEMETLIGGKSIAKLHLHRKREVESGEYQNKIKDLVKKISNTQVK